MEENGNFLHLSGVLTDNPVYGHEVFGEKFYYATLSVPRLSGAEDLLPITVSERLMDDTPLTIGSKLALDGQLLQQGQRGRGTPAHHGLRAASG